MNSKSPQKNPTPQAQQAQRFEEEAEEAAEQEADMGVILYKCR